MQHQMTYQKITSFLSLIAGVLFFVLGLGYSTNLYSLFYYIDESSMFYVEGSKIYYEVQDFNRLEIVLAIGVILLSAACYITMNNTRRKYYISNFVTTVVYSVYTIIVSVYVYVQNQIYLDKFVNGVDFETWLKWDEMLKTASYTESTFWFSAASCFSIIGIVVAGLVITNMIWKIVWMNAEKKAIKLYGTAKEA